MSDDDFVSLDVSTILIAIKENFNLNTLTSFVFKNSSIGVKENKAYYHLTDNKNNETVIAVDIICQDGPLRYGYDIKEPVLEMEKVLNRQIQLNKLFDYDGI